MVTVGTGNSYYTISATNFTIKPTLSPHKAYTTVAVEKCSLEWFIDVFSHIGSSALKSPAFSAVGGTLSFVLNLEPTQKQLKSDKVPKTYIRVYLTATAEKSTVRKPVLHCAYEFAFRKKSVRSLIVFKSGNTDSFQDWKRGQINVFNVGYENYIEKGHLTNSLINDALEIDVRVTASVSLATTAFLPTPSVKAPSATIALFKTRKFSDFVIRVQGTDIPIHKCVLALKSAAFEAMLHHDTREAQLGVLELKDTDLATAHAMVEFFYLDAVRKPCVALNLNLLRIADKYNVVDLARYCSNYLRENIFYSNVIDILVTASVLNVSELKECCFKYIAENQPFKLDNEQKKKLGQQKDLLIEFFCRKP